MPCKNIGVVCWSHNERNVQLNVNGVRRWFAVQPAKEKWAEGQVVIDGSVYDLGLSNVYPAKG